MKKYELTLYILIIITAITDLISTYGVGYEYTETNPIVWISDSFWWLTIIKIALVIIILYVSASGLKNPKSTEASKYGMILLLIYIIVMQGYVSYSNYQTQPEGKQIQQQMNTYKQNLNKSGYTPQQVQAKVQTIKTEIRTQSTKWYLKFQTLYILTPWLLSMIAFKLYQKINKEHEGNNQ